MLHHITAQALLSSMVFLALGVCGDFYIVSRVTGIGRLSSTSMAAGLLTLFSGAWFGYAFWQKQHLHDRRLTASHLKEHTAI